MPIYEYRCESCGHELEKIQRIGDEPLTDCPECGKPRLRRLISAAGFRLKGSGWYETDFKKDGKKNLHDASAPKSGSDKGGADKTAADKPAADKKPADSKPASTKTSAA